MHLRSLAYFVKILHLFKWGCEKSILTKKVWPQGSLSTFFLAKGLPQLMEFFLLCFKLLCSGRPLDVLKTSQNSTFPELSASLSSHDNIQHRKWTVRRYFNWSRCNLVVWLMHLRRILAKLHLIFLKVSHQKSKVSIHLLAFSGSSCITSLSLGESVNRIKNCFNLS